MNKLLLFLRKSDRSSSIGLTSLVLTLFFSLGAFAQNTITSFTPSVVTTRTVVRINGTGFTSSSEVKFGTTIVTKSSASATLITVEVQGTFPAGNLSVTTNSVVATAGLITYVAPVNAPNTSNVARVITDFNGYYNSTTTSLDPAAQPDTRHNLLGFTYGSTTYSTGVNDAIIANRGVAFTAGNFSALPLANFSGTSSSTSATYLVMGKKIDGNASAGVFSAPGVAGIRAKDNLIDGVKGLDLGTGVTNIPANTVMEYTISSILPSAINDNQPDIVISQIADPTDVADYFVFTDANGNIVGNPINGNFKDFAARGRYKVDLFTLNSTTLATATSSTVISTGQGTRDIWVMGLKLSEFGITAANAGLVTKFKVLPGGTSDPAFFAYNGDAINIAAPVITSQPISQVVCPGTGGSATFTVVATGANLTYQWKKNGADIAGATSSSYVVNPVTTSDVGYYSVQVSNSNGSVISNNAFLNAVVTYNPAALSTCRNSSAVLSTLGNGVSITYQWFSNTADNNTDGLAITGATSATYSAPTTVAGILYYYAKITAGGQNCTTVTTTQAGVTVSSTNSATASGTTTICSGSTATLSVTGSSGTIRWQKSLDGTTGWEEATGTGTTATTFTTSPLSVTTYYRVFLEAGSCPLNNSNVVVITVSQPSVGGTVASNQIICSGSAAANLVLSGNTGNVTSWQSSATSDFAVTTTINNTTNTLTSAQIGLLTETTYFRAVVQSGNCPAAFSAAAIITVNPTSVGGTVSGDQTVCVNSTAAAITLSGNVGNVISWQRSATADFASPMTIANTTNILSVEEIGAVTGTTYFRAVVQSGLCPVAFSTVATVGTASTTWNGTSWSNGTPTSSTAAIFTGNFSSTANIDACSVYVDGNAVVKINSGNRVSIYGAITVVTGSFTLEDNANLLQQTTVTNSGNIIVKRTTTTPLKRLDYVLWSSPVIGQNLFSFSPATLANRFYTYNPASNLYVVVTTPPATTNFETGKGYLIRTPNTFSDTTPSPLTLAFTGEPRNGDVSVPVAAGLYNAIGNPYPSAINADSFINTNLITEPLYFWRKVNNTVTSSYATYTFAGGTGTESNTGGLSALTPTGIIQAGQGFITIAPTSAVTFNNSMRTNSAGPFFRTSEIERNRIWLNLTNTEGAFSQTMVAYMTGGSSAIDTNLDGLYINDSETALTTVIEGAEYAIQARALPFVATDVVPVGFKATTAGTYTIGLDSVDGLFTDVNQPIYLKDNLAGTEQNLRNGNYTFSTEGGVSNSRFEIVYTASLATVDQNFNANSVVVYKQNQQIFINTGKANMKNVKVYDVRGRLLVEKNNINSNETSVNAGETNQVLIVKITSDDNVVVSKKVVN